jgi:deazaflavin-dependent oxidoreductase (nitroreductase family)
MIGATSGKVRKIGLMRVEHEGEYALVASKGGHPEHPAWYANLLADPHIMIQDGATPRDYSVRQVEGAERQEWWDRGVRVYPPYADYAAKTERVIPVLIASPL